MKKRSEESQTLRAGCSKVEPKNFATPQTLFPGWWGSMHAISSYRGNRPTHTHIHPTTNRQDRLQYTAPQLASSVNYFSEFWQNTFYGWSRHIWRLQLLVLNCFRIINRNGWLHHTSSSLHVSVDCATSHTFSLLQLYFHQRTKPLRQLWSWYTF